MYPLIRPCCSPSIREQPRVTIAALHLAGRIPAARPDDSPPGHGNGHRLSERVGLAAGRPDKNGEAIDGLARLGFGFIEIGTVTPRAQPGNPRPRMFRLPEGEGHHQSHGFQQPRVDALIANVRAAKYRGVLGINIGKNFDTPSSVPPVDDYLSCLDKVYALASYVAVNISSPNTRICVSCRATPNSTRCWRPQGRQLQLAEKHGRYVRWRSRSPRIWAGASRSRRSRMPCVGTASTGDRHQYDHLARKVRGRYAEQQGGLSGAPVFEGSTVGCRSACHCAGGRNTDHWRRRDTRRSPGPRQTRGRGASLVQLYSGLVYRGPGAGERSDTQQRTFAAARMPTESAAESPRASRDAATASPQL